ncbi:KTSC domain-containing protein [Mesorhizobium sp. M1322]|uniref:KTSC domain-containing protein n=1 Tax=Mesorhizobium sp. M1322 TaxID=2957081 RepID=UPI00333DAB63
MPSTSIRKTEYDPVRKVLSVWFVASGKLYEFEDVPPETFAEFRAAFARAASSTSTSAITSATVWLDRRSTEQQRTISFGRDAAHSSWPSGRPFARQGRTSERKADSRISTAR